MASSSQSRPVLFVTSPLEREHVDRIQDVAGDRIEIRYEPDLLAPIRYVADHKGVGRFERSGSQQQRYMANLAGANILWDFPSLPDQRTTLAQAAPALQWVQTTSSGVGQLVHQLGLASTDLKVTTASGVHAEPLAEFVMLVLLSQMKQLSRLQTDQMDRRWVRYCGDELPGKTMAIVGPGKIGKRVAEVAHAFGMRVSAMGRRNDPARARELGVDRMYGKDQMLEMLAEADCVVLCCPHTPETENLIDARAFQAMKDGVIFVNISRGQVVVEDALYNALTSGKIGFAGLDVFREEPLPVESPFWDLPNVLVSPHSASTAYSENGKITEIFCHNLECFLDGRIADMKNLLDFDAMY
ncbi:MAG: D-2-hydroxyacid dehydrogenase [Thermomicrobiaceae bacterium]